MEYIARTLSTKSCLLPGVGEAFVGIPAIDGPGPAPNGAPAVIGSVGRSVGRVNAPNVPGTGRGVAVCATSVGAPPIGTARCAAICFPASP